MSDRKSSRTRAHLIRVAAEVFAAKGYTAARLADLVAASGLTKGAFYFHFPSKEAAAGAVLAATQQEWLHALGPRLAAVPVGGRRQALIDAIVDLATNDPAAWAAFRLCADLHDAPALADAIRRHNQTWIDLVSDVLRADAPNADPARIQACAIGLVGAVAGVRDLLAGLHAQDQVHLVLTTLADATAHFLDKPYGELK
ncbi:TetR/AcrR family transcriptional regulator [Salinispora arenicola]|uniref:TetR/AcrR family transcriptional regulator n=1 Tax=Salinispora arenicola TaxID=168697 RepID=UPI001E5A0402|nr:TetR/AcrR family transcriptional regulator [Salinispora arenicola]MCN0154035.1 TetR/AcrR family transcriptional regulator [Salinispora arenicola]